MSQVNSYDREQYATDGVTKTFSFGWDVNSTDDVKVNFVRDDGTILNVGTFINSDDQEYTTSNFSFVVELNRQGGTITFADTPADDQNIIIWRETELVYENSFKTATAFPAAAIDKAYRKIWLALQEVQSDVIHNTVRMTPNQRGLHFSKFSEDVTDHLVYYSDQNKELLFTPFAVTEVQNALIAVQSIPSIAGDAAEALSRATSALTIAGQAKSDAQIARQDAATAIQIANNIDGKAQTALNRSQEAKDTADDAKEIAEDAAETVGTFDGRLIQAEQDASDAKTAAQDAVSSVGNKVDKTNVANKVYGTDTDGNQTTYDVGGFGQVDDVQVNNVSVVTSKVAKIDLTPYAKSANLATVATSGLYSDLSGTPTIPTTLAGLTGDVSISSPSNGEHLVYNGTSQKWENTASAATVSWGDITGTLSNQTDLQNALNGKVATGHEVIDFQEPNAENNYTWYRKYRDGWVEQGGWISGLSNGVIDWRSTVITLPIQMANTNYTAIASDCGIGSNYTHGNHVATTSSTQITYNYFNGSSQAKISWQVSGMAA